MRRMSVLAGLVVAVAGLSPVSAADPSPAEKAAADWLYPGAKTTAAGQGGSVSCVTQETADDAAKVFKHYGEKVGIDLGGRGSSSGSTGGFQYATSGLAPDGGTGCVCAIKTKTASVTVIVYRPRDGKVTAVTVTYVSLGEGK